MPIRKFRNVDQMNQPRWREPGDPDLYRTIARLWKSGQITNRRRFPPGFTATIQSSISMRRSSAGTSATWTRGPRSQRWHTGQ